MNAHYSKENKQQQSITIEKGLLVVNSRRLRNNKYVKFLNMPNNKDAHNNWPLNACDSYITVPAMHFAQNAASTVNGS